MSGINFINSVAPSYNALSNLLGGSGVSLGTAVTPDVGGGDVRIGPLGARPTQFRQPTRVRERGTFGGTSWRDTNEDDHRQYRMQHLRDRRNVGYGAGQVDPRLARAQQQKDSQRSGGK